MMITNTKRRKGNIGLFILFIFISFIFITLFGLVIPVLIDIETGFYEGAEDILGEIDTSQIDNPVIKAELDEALSDSQESIPTQITILSTFFKYSWFIFIVIILAIFFMISRQAVEVDTIR